MAITQAMCTSFKEQLLKGDHDFTTSTGHTFNIALYTNSASLDATTTDYTTSGEVSSSGTNYSAAGQALTIASSMPTTSGTTAFVDFDDEVFSSVTLTARGALIYNTTTGGGSNTTDAVAVLDFGSDKSATSGDFTIVFPTADASNAIIRLATPA
jgi:hypothetical protein